MCSLKLLFLCGGFPLLLSHPALSQNVDLAVGGGGGFSAPAGYGATAIGASIGGPQISKHRLQLDYLFHNNYSRDERGRHLVTVSYVRQAKAGRARSFFQAGGGFAALHYLDWNPWPPGGPVPQSKSHTGFAALLGGGVTIAMGQSFFIRPEIRLYTHNSEGILLATLGVGWRF